MIKQPPISRADPGGRVTEVPRLWPFCWSDLLQYEQMLTVVGAILPLREPGRPSAEQLSSG